MVEPYVHQERDPRAARRLPSLLPVSTRETPDAKASRRARRASRRGQLARARRHSGPGRRFPRRARAVPGDFGTVRLSNTSVGASVSFPSFPVKYVTVDVAGWTKIPGRLPARFVFVPVQTGRLFPGLHPFLPRRSSPRRTRRRPRSSCASGRPPRRAPRARTEAAPLSRTRPNVDAGHRRVHNRGVPGHERADVFRRHEIPVRAEPELHVVVVHAEHPAVAVQHHEHVVVGLGFRRHRRVTRARTTGGKILVPSETRKVTALRRHTAKATTSKDRREAA